MVDSGHKVAMTEREEKRREKKRQEQEKNLIQPKYKKQK